jgi:hypothetical protein
MTEQTRAEVHTEDQTEWSDAHDSAQIDRINIADREEKQVQAISVKLTNTTKMLSNTTDLLKEHIVDNKVFAAETSTKLNKLSPLTDNGMIESLQRIVKKEENNIVVSEFVGKWLRIGGIVLGVIGTFAGILWAAVAIATGMKGGR